MKLLSVTLLALVAFCSAQKNPHFWDNRSGMVHLFEWPFSAIAEECQFLADKGYAGVQVSPITENYVVSGRPWWERYQPISYNIASRSGDEAAFLDMTTQCNALGIRIYVDVVFNHMTGEWGSEAYGTGGSVADTTNKDYPAVGYTTGHFHTTCTVTDYSDAENVRNCEVNGLKDLDQSNSYVRQKIIDLLNKLVSLGAAGFRIDAAKHMYPANLEYIYSQINDLNTDFGFAIGSRPFIFQEVIDLGTEGVHASEYTDIARVTEFLHSTTIGGIFRGGESLFVLSTWGADRFLASEDALVFVDNHDNQRGHGAGGDSILTYKTDKLYKMANAFMLAQPYAIPRVMSSFDFEDTDEGPPQDTYGNIIAPSANSAGTCDNGWVCEHRWRQIYGMIGFMNAVKGTALNDWWTNGYNQIAFCRGDAGFIAITSEGDIEESLQTCLPAGTYCDVISGELQDGVCTGKMVVVGDDGYGYVSLYESDEDGVLAIHVNAKLA